MKIQQLKKVKKNFEEVHKESETKQINIKINGCELFITEQQVGIDLSLPYVILSTPTGTYEMDFQIFISKVTE